MEFIYVLLGLGCGFVRADTFHISLLGGSLVPVYSVEDIFSSSPITMPIINPCRVCTLSLGAGELHASPELAYNPTRTYQTTTYIVFTAYKVVSDYSHKGTTGCSTFTGSPVTLATAFSATKAVGADPRSFSTSAAAQFINFLGFTTCKNGASVNGLLPRTNSTMPSASSTSPTVASKVSVASYSPSASLTVQSLSSAPLSNSNSSAANTSQAPKISNSNLTTSEKIAIGIVIPIVVLSGFLLAFLVLRRHRKRAKSSEGTNGIPPSHADTQPYLQQKGELDAEEKRRYELHAQDLRYEVNGEDEIHEAPEKERRNEHGATERSVLSNPARIQELRGEECAKELDESEGKTLHSEIEVK